MFSRDPNLETIYVSSDFDLSHVSTGSWEGRSVFSEDYKIKGGAGTMLTNGRDTALYGRIDDPDNGKPGYFTLKDN